MKQFLTILLLLVTAFYVLPLSNTLAAENEIACKCVEKNTDENTKTEKENQKEFLAGASFLYTAKFYAAPLVPVNIYAALPVHYTVETPPPNNI